MIDLEGQRPVPRAALQAMANALLHRGPDDDGFLERPGLGLASRRLSIVGLDDGRQPQSNEREDVSVVYNGELFDYPEIRADLEQRGHIFRSHTDTELLPHLWEEHGADMLPGLRGQFALALWDERQRTLLLARDRFGICPLYWTRQDGWLLFASEIKGLLASGMVPARADPRGIDHLFTVMSLPGPVTCFAGIQSLPPGRFLRVQLGVPGQAATLQEDAYWDVSFPDAGHEDAGKPEKDLIEELESLLYRSVKRRLRADVPVVVTLSGGVDSALVAAMVNRAAGHPLATFSIGVEAAGMNESTPILSNARSLGIHPHLLHCDRGDLLEAYPRFTRAAEAPVIDVAGAAVLLLSQQIHAHGYKVALTGQGADEALAGYSWFKTFRYLTLADRLTRLPVSEWIRRAGARWNAPHFDWSFYRDCEAAVGGPNAYLDLFGLMVAARFRFFSKAMKERLSGHVAYQDMKLSADLPRWHPLNRSLYLGARTLLSGLLLTAKGDQASMHSSVELRHPFLDEDVFDFCCRLPPHLKLNRWREKYLLRRVAERWLPPAAVWRRKSMFLAPADTLFHEGKRTRPRPAFVAQLLSPESLERTGYFDAAVVHRVLGKYGNVRFGSFLRNSLELGLAAVVATQLWHHLFLGGGLCEL